MIYAWIKWSSNGKEMNITNQYILKFDTDDQSKIEDVLMHMRMDGRYFLTQDFRANDPPGLPVILISPEITLLGQEAGWDMSYLGSEFTNKDKNV